MLKSVIKYDGSVEEFCAGKLNKWAQYATKTGGDWSEIALATYKRLPEVAKASDIHQMMINVCLDKEEISYSRIAARLEQASLRKNMERLLGVGDRNSFKDIYFAMLDKGIWDNATMPAYNPLWESWYEEIYPNRLEYWQIVQWGDKYAIRKEGVPVETPHIGCMGIGLGLHGDTQEAFDLAKALVEGKVNLPTPALNGIRTGDFDTISCCIITGGDTVDSIGVAEHIAYKMTAKKAGIGIEFDTRSKGSPVKGGAVDHLGKHSIYATLDKAVKMFTQMCYDGETEVLTARGWKCFKDLVPEDLIAQVNDDRTLEFVPHTTFVSYEINQDKKMVKFSNKYVNAFVTDNHKMVYRTKKYESPVTSAGSYSECRADEFRASRCNVLDFGGHKVGSIDKLSAQDKFRIALQADGTVRVNKTCENTYVFTFNKQRKISEFRDLLGQLGLEEKCEKSQDRGYSVNLRKNGNGVGTIFTVSKVGFDCDKTLSWVYDRDFSCEWGKEFLEYVSKWDATTTGTHFEYYTKDMQNVDVVQFVAACCGLYSKADDIKSRSCYTVRVSQFESVTSEGVKKEIVEDYIGKVYCVEVPSHRLVVRREGRTLVCGNTRGGSATMTFKCIDPEVESIVMWKTQRVDIETRLDKMDYSFAYNDAFLQAVIGNEDWYLFDLVEAPEVHEAFYVLKATAYNEVVSQAIDAGKKFKKLKARDLLKSMLIARNETGRVYSINVTRVNEHTPFTDVVRLSNLCQEVTLPTKEYGGMQDLYAEESVGETAFCTLAAINVAKVSFTEYEHIASVALKAVDLMIDKAPMMTTSMKNSIMRRRSAGVGITGLASALYKNGLDYDGSEESFSFVSKLAEHHYFYLLKASQQLSKESGYAVEGIKKDWLPIDTSYNKDYTSTLDWEALRGKDRKHSVLVAHMPTESSALFCDAPNSLYPIRQAVINKKSRKGVIQYICKEWTKGTLLAWDVDNTTLSKYYSRVQDFSDQAISADYYFDPSKYEDEKKPLSELMKEWVAQAKLGNKTQYYMNTRDYNGGGIQELLGTSVEEEACESCKL